jgi:hypothetical protein
MLMPENPERASRYLAMARANASKRGSRPELARCNLLTAQLGLVPRDEAARLATGAYAAFVAMDMPTLAAEAERVITTAKVPA